MKVEAKYLVKYYIWPMLLPWVPGLVIKTDLEEKRCELFSDTLLASYFHFKLYILVLNMVKNKLWLWF